MNKRMNRRDFLRLSATTAGGGLLAACVVPAAAPDESGSAMAEEPIEIRLAEGSWVGPEGHCLLDGRDHTQFRGGKSRHQRDI